MPEPASNFESSVPVSRHTCCVVGGGPAGMMLGLLLARAGVDVVVLEKHGDFLRDFRGDTIHPSTLELMRELGMLDALLQLPHQKAHQLAVQFGDVDLTIADFSHLRTTCKYVAFMPQWDFLNFLAGQARAYPNFRLCMDSEVHDLVFEGERVVGIRAHTPEGPVQINADLVVGTDGRGSTVRERAGLPVEDLGAPMDVLWMRLSRLESDPAQTMGRASSGRILILIDRRDYWQCAYVIVKGEFEAIRSRGLDTFRTELRTSAPFLGDRVNELRDWSQIRLLTVRVDRLQRWYLPGLLCIGDAAHAMSPIGGVGINLAIQDAVAAANVLCRPLREHRVEETLLRSVQRQRELPTKLTQTVQLVLQHRIRSLLQQPKNGSLSLPLPFRALRRWPWLRRIPGYFVGLGFRPEHIRAVD